MLRYSYPQVVLREVPGEITLALSISGCPLRCKGCHSAETRDPNFGLTLSLNELQALISKNKYITCVLFYGGEWNTLYLIRLMEIVKKNGLKIALYSGYDLGDLSPELVKMVDYLKVGNYVENLGALESKTTNQRFYLMKEGEIIGEHKFYT